MTNVEEVKEVPPAVVCTPQAGGATIAHQVANELISQLSTICREQWVIEAINDEVHIRW